VPIVKINRDGSTRTRAGVRPEVVEEYADDYKAGDGFPEVVLFTEDEQSFWIGDGEHRIEARLKAGFKDVQADVRRGGKREAILHSAGSNKGKGHGLRRSNEDKRQAVAMLLADEEWAQATDRWVADQCRVSHPLVAEVRAALAAANNGQSGGEEIPYGNSSKPENNNSATSSKRVGRRGGTGTARGAVKCDKCKRLKLNNPNCRPCKEALAAAVKKKMQAQFEKDRKKQEREERKANKLRLAAERKEKKEIEKAQREAEKARRADEKQAAKDKRKADAEAARKAREEAKRPPDDENPEDMMKRVNGEIESFCRGLMKYVEENLPRDHWLDVDNRREGAVRKFTDGCDMLRACKCSAVCPVCKGEKYDRDGKNCRPCHGTGRMPKLNLDMAV
jgi:hypothetical protein